MTIEDDDNSQNRPEPSSLAADARGIEWSIEIAAPATLSGILPDLLMHAPRRRSRSWIVYLCQLALTALTSSGFHMMFCHRIGAFCHRYRLSPLCLLVEKFIFHWYYCVIPCSARIGPGIWAPHPLGIVLNSRCRLGANCWLRQFTEIVDIPVQEAGKSGVVGDRVQLNSGAILLRGAVVAHDSIVAARSLVTKFVPTGHVAKGSPAQLSPMRPEQFLDTTPKWR
jgi:serine acetyltransferase